MLAPKANSGISIAQAIQRFPEPVNKTAELALNHLCGTWGIETIDHLADPEQMNARKIREKFTSIDANLAIHLAGALLREHGKSDAHFQ